MDNSVQIPAKEKVSALEKVLVRIRGLVENKLHGEIKVRVVAGKIKEATYNETEHFD